MQFRYVQFQLTFETVFYGENDVNSFKSDSEYYCDYILRQ